MDDSWIVWSDLVERNICKNLIKGFITALFSANNCCRYNALLSDKSMLPRSHLQPPKQPRTGNYSHKVGYSGHSRKHTHNHDRFVPGLVLWLDMPHSSIYCMHSLPTTAVTVSCTQLVNSVLRCFRLFT